MRDRLALSSVLLSSAFLVSCYGGIPLDTNGCVAGDVRVDDRCLTPHQTDIVLSPQGGEYPLTGDGALYAPAGAVSEDTSISVTVFTGPSPQDGVEDPIQSLVRFAPSGLTFAEPLAVFAPTTAPLPPGELLTAIGVEDGIDIVTPTRDGDISTGADPGVGMITPDGNHVYFHQTHFSSEAFVQTDLPFAPLTMIEYFPIDPVDKYGQDIGGPDNRVWLSETSNSAFIDGWFSPWIDIGNPCVGVTGVKSANDFECRRYRYKHVFLNTLLQPDASVAIEEKIAHHWAESINTINAAYSYSNGFSDGVLMTREGAAFVRDHVLEWHKNSTFKNVKNSINSNWASLAVGIQGINSGIAVGHDVLLYMAHISRYAEAQDRIDALDDVILSIDSSNDPLLRDGAVLAGWSDAKAHIEAGLACLDSEGLSSAICSTGRFLQFIIDAPDGGAAPQLDSALLSLGWAIIKKSVLFKLALPKVLLLALAYSINTYSQDTVYAVENEVMRALNGNALYLWPTAIDLDRIESNGYSLTTEQERNEYLAMQAGVYLAHTYAKMAAASVRQEEHTLLWRAAWRVFMESKVCPGTWFTLCPDHEKIEARELIAENLDSISSYALALNDYMADKMYAIDYSQTPGENEDGTPRFLSNPLDNLEVRNGWEYNFAGNGAGHHHGAIDYAAEIGTPFYASCDGVAMASSQYASGFGYGNFVQVRCNQTSPDDEHYHLIYAHISSPREGIPTYASFQRWTDDYGNWEQVSKGQLLGYTGIEDTIWPHLHFEVQLGSYAGPSVDPYDIYAETTSASNSSEQEYPPSGNRFNGCGPSALWISCGGSPEGGGQSCPSGNGLYCGDPDLGQDSDHLYSCQSGAYSLNEACTDGCIVAPPGQNDYCSGGSQSCPSGNGLYCGSLDLGQDPGHLYSCTNGMYSLAEQCTDGCVTARPGQNDYCGAGSGCPSGNGMYCGDTDLGQDPDTLYECVDGSYSMTEICPEGCTVAPPGQNDYCTNAPCQCNSGACCDGCFFRPANTVCEANAQTDYACTGLACGDDVTVSYRDRYCSGFDASCSGTFGNWSVPQLFDQCLEEESCTPGNSACSFDPMCSCTDTYQITQYQCQNYSFASGVGPGGGEIFEVCATVNQGNGFMTVKARKLDGTNFGNRPYQVRVSLVDQPCGPDGWFYVVSDDSPQGIGTDELTFTFQSIWEPGQEEKDYCITASTQLGDLGYDPNNNGQQAWWYSKKATLIKTCN